MGALEMGGKLDFPPTLMGHTTGPTPRLLDMDLLGELVELLNSNGSS